MICMPHFYFNTYLILMYLASFRFPYIKLRSDDHPLLDDFGAGYINPRNMVAAQKTVAKSQGCDIIDDVVHEVKPLVNGIHEVSIVKINIKCISIFLFTSDV